MIDLTLDDVRRALALPDFDVAGAWMRMVPRQRRLDRPPELNGEARGAAVLLLLYPAEKGLSFVLTRRTESVATHKGQVSLPGGAQESGEPLEQTALRETCEEIGVCAADITILGALSPLFVVVSDFQIHHFVGYVPERPDFHPDPVEVAELLEMPLADLLDDRIKALEQWTLGGMELDVLFYRVGDHPVWGATAIILSELEHRLRAAVESPLT